MVSQASPSPSSALTLRGLPPASSASVVGSSRRSRHQHHHQHDHGRARHGRSHTGGREAPARTQNEFPVFENSGDVEILIAAGARTNRYLLHRVYLERCSAFFEDDTTTATTTTGPSPAGESPSQAGWASQLVRINEAAGSEVGSPTGEEGAWSSTRATGAPAPRRTRWRYELDRRSGSHDLPMLVRTPTSTIPFLQDPKPPPVRNKPASTAGAHPSFFRSVANLSLISHHTASASAAAAAAKPTSASTPLTQADQDLLTAYDNLFRTFYNYAPVLDSLDIATAYIQCKTLLLLASAYDALAVVGPRVDHHLLQYQSRLWKQVAKYPCSYLRLGYLAQSRTIFQEALIHVVGAWPAGARHLRHQLPLDVLELIEDKVDELAEVVARIEGRLFRIGLTTSRGERVTPTTSYNDWLVLNFFRSWVVEQTTPAPPPPPAPATSSSAVVSSHRRGHRHSSSVSASGADPSTAISSSTGAGATSSVPTTTTLTTTATASTSSSTSPTSLAPINIGRVYRTIGIPGLATSYLTHDDCKKFLRLTPELYTRDSLRRFERRLDEVKALAREVVRPLMVSELLLADVSGCAYLVCTRVREEDFPWE